jgi:hypothetical protein
VRPAAHNNKKNTVRTNQSLSSSLSPAVATRAAAADFKLGSTSRANTHRRSAGMSTPANASPTANAARMCVTMAAGTDLGTRAASRRSSENTSTLDLSASSSARCTLNSDNPNCISAR